MSLPAIKTYSVDTQGIHLYWKATPKSDIKYWNVYGAKNVPIDMNTAKGVDISGFTLIKSGIANYPDPLTPNSVYAKFTREELDIAPEDSYYFLISSVNTSDVESSLERENLHAVPSQDDYFVDEAGEPVNVVYKNFEFSLSQTVGWDADRYLDMVTLLGRPAKQIRILMPSGTSTLIRINSFNNDVITLTSAENASIPFALTRGEIQFMKIWFHNPNSGASSLKIFVAG